jgi:hypothetical protein
MKIRSRVKERIRSTDLWAKGAFQSSPHSEQACCHSFLNRKIHDSYEAQTHLQSFLLAYNFAKRLKTLTSLTPYEYICKILSEDHTSLLLTHAITLWG